MPYQILSDTLLREIGNLYDKADNYDIKIQVGEDSNMEILKAHSVLGQIKLKCAIIVSHDFCYT